MSGEGSVAGEGRVVGVPMFHSWGKCTMPLMNINSDRMSNASSGLCVNLSILVTRSLFHILGCKYRAIHNTCNHLEGGYYVYTLVLSIH